MKALQYLEEKCATILLENGADPNAHNNRNETPLHFALSLKKTSLAEKLLSLNANIEARTTSGYTPLLLAIEQNRQQMVETLIQNKANIHAVDQNGRTALMFALEQKSKHIVEMLLQSGIDVSAADNFGKMALAYAIASGDTSLKELILQYMKVESKHPENINPMDEDSMDDNFKRIFNTTDPDDHCLTLDEANYKYYEKDTPKENGELPHTSNELKNDEETNETEEPKLKTLPGNCDIDIKKKNVIETTPVEEINIKNYNSNFSSSVGSKITGP
nr:putative ankyrin repeat domain-containing protein 19 isoform X2 [Ictidomys tridecemlineatus]XP_040129395.1 putative ankyrin repeat domain-containing protein 19 isoform X2 [Ictidomys tridecemlineatus]